MCDDAWIFQKSHLAAEEIASYVGTYKLSLDDVMHIQNKIAEVIRDALRKENNNVRVI